ncbi:unnamed protein product [Urochloa humidicola]
MDPQLQKILDELKSVGNYVADLKVSLTTKIDEVDKTLGARFENLEEAAKVLEDWKPKVDASIEDLHIEVDAMRKTVNRVVLDSDSASAGIFAKPVATAALSPKGNQGMSQEGQRDEKLGGGKMCGTVYTLTSPECSSGMFTETNKQLRQSSSQPLLSAHLGSSVLK